MRLARQQANNTTIHETNIEINIAVQLDVYLASLLGSFLLGDMHQNCGPLYQDKRKTVQLQAAMQHTLVHVAHKP